METIVEFDLPFLLPVPDDVYRVTIRGKTAAIVLSRIQEKEHKLSKDLEGSPFKMDVRIGPLFTTRVTIKFPVPLDLRQRSPPSRLLGHGPKRKVKELSIEFVNRLIEVVRFVTKQIPLDRIGYFDVASYDAYHWDGKQRLNFVYIRGESRLVGLGISWTAQPFPEEQRRSIHELLSNEGAVDLSDSFVLNAKGVAFVEDYRRATLDAVTALEVRLSEFIRRRGQKLGISKDRIDDFIIDVGLTANIDVVLRMLTERLEQPDPKALSACKGAIKVRNAILHRGLTDVPRSETEERIDAIEVMCSYLNRLIQVV